MNKHILIIQGHPDRSRQHLCHALADAYADGARAAGHSVEIIEPARLDFPLLDDAAQWQDGTAPASLLPVQEAITRAGHIVLVYPLWLGDMPALLKGFLEQVLRPGFAIRRNPANPLKAGLLGGRSARVVVTMGMPSLVYRAFYRAHSLRALRRNILHFVGIAPVSVSIVGGAGEMAPERAARWCERLRRLGARAA
jgi:putative NADPH-quinone reductase